MNENDVIKAIAKELLQGIVKQGVKQFVKLADEKREPVADAARTLHLDHGFTLNWLRARKAEKIIGACVAANRNRDVYAGLIKEGSRCLVAGESVSLWGPAYPDREKTATAAQYLWRVTTGCLLTRQSSLRACPADVIRAGAAMRQGDECSVVADNAWIAFDEGACKPETLKSASAAAIKHVADDISESREVRKNSTIELTAAEVSSGLDRVKWAEGLIKQLPEDHEGRNSWLMNYGEKTDAPSETVELKIYSLSNGTTGAEIVVRFYDAKCNEVFERKRSGRVKYSAQRPFIDRFDVPGGYSFHTASVVGECCFTVERVAK